MLTGLIAATLVLGAPGLSIRVEGEGYLRFLREGRAIYARQAELVVERGELREKSGPGFLPPIRVGSGLAVSFEADGTVRAGDAKTPVGRLYLARFPEASTFEPSGAFVLARDRAALGYPGAGGFGRIVAVGAAPKNEEPKTKVEPAEPPIRTPVPQNRNTPIPQSRNTDSLTISIPASIEVDGPRFTLGEIAQIQGPEAAAAQLKAIDLGNAPVHGVPMLFSRERMLARVTLSGFDRKSIDLQMPLTVQIARKGQTVTPDQFLEVARKAVEEKLGLKGDLDSADRLSDLRVPVGKLELVQEGISLSGNVAIVPIGIRIDGRRFTGRTVRLTGPCLDKVVPLGAAVTVRFLSNGLSVELPGKAREAGAIGQTIDVAVTIPETRETTIHQAVVVSAGVVEVKL